MSGLPATVRVVGRHPEMGGRLPWPRRATPGAAGWDVVAAVDEAGLVLGPGERAWVATGIALELPDGMEAQVRPRSGLAGQHGIGCLNSPGTIDADFRGEVRVLLVNHGTRPFTVAFGMRIAQLVFARLPQVELALGGEAPLAPSARGEAGFGSTGT